jgi:2',3'-cyclic-nucleotide 2'-phosphodiesterase (5'-nucleotidase family)
MKVRLTLLSAMVIGALVTGLGMAAPASAVVPPGTAGFTAMTPVRVLDTRNGIGGPEAPLLAGDVRILDLSAVVPVGADAVVLNLTGTNVTSHTYVTAWPDGDARPNASNLNLSPGQTQPNLVTVALGPARQIDLFNHVGSVDLIADLAGYYALGTGAGYTAMMPQRVLDTRNGVGGPTTPLFAGTVRTLDLSSIVPVGTTAVVFNLTGTDVTDDTYVTAWPDGVDRPNASNLNLSAGQTEPNLVTVALGANRTIDLFNHFGTVDLIGDLEGFYSAASSAGFVSVAPNRVLDTRNAIGSPRAPLGPGAVRVLDLSSAVPVGTTAAVFNLTGTNVTAATYETAWPDGAVQPVASNLNLLAGQTVPNLVSVAVGPDRAVDLYNNAGRTDLIADLAGYFVFGP